MAPWFSVSLQISSHACLIALAIRLVLGPTQLLAAPVAVGDRGAVNCEGGDATFVVAERVLLNRGNAVLAVRCLARVDGIKLHFHADRAGAAVVIGEARVAANPGRDASIGWGYTCDRDAEAQRGVGGAGGGVERIDALQG